MPEVNVQFGGFEPRTSASAVWCATEKPPHIQILIFETRDHNNMSTATATAFPSQLATALPN